MSTQQLAAVADAATIEHLSTGLNRCFETFDPGTDLFAANAFFDLLPPQWRFQLEGGDAFAHQLRSITEVSSTVRLLRVVPTATGFVMEHEETQHLPDPVVARRLILCEVRDGLIAEVTVYCNGGWDDALRARHAAEAPMLRP